MQTVEIEVKDVEKETDKAILIVLDEDAGEYAQYEKVWVPKSQIHDDSEVWKEDDEGTLVVSKWWAEKNNLA